MQFGYNKETDVAYIYFIFPIKDDQIAKTIDIENTFLFDFDEHDKLIGIEILDATEYLNMAISPRFEHDEKENSFYLYLHYPFESNIVDYSTNIEEIAEIILDFDKNNKLMGIEILNVSDFLHIEELDRNLQICDDMESPP